MSILAQAGPEATIKGFYLWYVKEISKDKFPLAEQPAKMKQFITSRCYNENKKAYDNNEFGADYFIQKNVENLLRKCPSIDTVLLACTHYPILIEKIRNCLPSSISIVAQGEIISCSLEDYLKRHPEIDRICTKNYTQKFYTTDSAEFFNTKASEFLQLHIESQHLAL